MGRGVRVRLVLALTRARLVSSVSLRSFSEDPPRPSASRVSHATNRARPSSDAHVRRVVWDLRLGSKGNQSGFVLRIEGNASRVERERASFRIGRCLGRRDAARRKGGFRPFERKPSPFHRPIERTIGSFRWGETQPFEGSILSETIPVPSAIEIRGKDSDDVAKRHRLEEERHAKVFQSTKRSAKRRGRSATCARQT